MICSSFKGCPQNTKDTLKKYYDNCEELHIDVPQSFIDDIIQFNDSFVSSSNLDRHNSIDFILSLKIENALTMWSSLLVDIISSTPPS